jgi:hypothetical protein
MRATDDEMIDGLMAEKNVLMAEREALISRLALARNAPRIVKRTIHGTDMNYAIFDTEQPKMGLGKMVSKTLREINRR